MKQKVNKILFTLLRSAICGNKQDIDKNTISSEELTRELYELSRKHDVAHLVGIGLGAEANFLKDNQYVDRFSKETIKAVYRYERLNYDLEKICRAFDAAELPYMPLKGSVIRKFYDAPWMRTSCDIDILIHKEDIEKASAVLIDMCGCKRDAETTHDISFFTKNRNNAELHYSLTEEGVSKKVTELLDSVWDTAILKSGYCYEMPDEMFYFYHIAHMAKHFENGGCGIRPFIDLWILDNLEGDFAAKRNELLERGELLKFAESARKISRVWFGSEDHDDVTLEMEKYILRGGAFGTAENRISVQQQKKGGSWRYIKNEIFLSYEHIKHMYPVLKKHRWLTPVMQVRRWFRIIFEGRAGQAISDLKYSRSMTRKENAKVKEFLKRIGL